MVKRYFEVEFSNNNTIDRSIDGCGDEMSICIVGTDWPSIEEAADFCKADMERNGYKFVVSVSELSEEEAYAFYDMSREKEFPIFNKHKEDFI